MENRQTKSKKRCSHLHKKIRCAGENLKLLKKIRNCTAISVQRLFICARPWLNLRSTERGSEAMRPLAVILLAGLALVAGPQAALAQQLVARYVAFIGSEDLYNSQGQRLWEPWQVLRQDRANVHRFGISQPGDQGDPFFHSAANRALMEQMVMRGKIDAAAATGIVNGGVSVEVAIYRQGGTDYVEVTVWH